MLIRSIAYCGLATSACWAGTAYLGASSQLTSTARSVPTLDQVSRIQTPGFMSAGRNFDSYVLYGNGGSANSASTPAPEVTVVQASYQAAPFQVDNSSYYSFDGVESPRQFVNLLAGSTTVGLESSDSSASSVSSFSAYEAAGVEAVSGALADTGNSGGGSLTNDPGTLDSGSAFSSKYDMTALAGRTSAPQVVALAAEPVPEPSTGVAAGLASGLLLWMRHRARRRK